jgi:thiol-disulfide isomerase/thioredoxin
MTDAPREPMTFWVEVLPDTVQTWTEVPPNSKDQVFRLDPNEYIELPPEWRVYGDLEAHQRREGYRETGARLAFTLPDLDGKLVSLPSERFAGKVVLVNLFGTWCGGCLAEIPYLVRLKDQYEAQGLEIIGIAFESDASATSIAAVRQLARRTKINYPVLFGGQAQREHLLSVIKGIRRFKGYPTTFFVGRDGTIGAVKIGFDTVTEARAQWHMSRMEKTIVRLLEE